MKQVGSSEKPLPVGPEPSGMLLYKNGFLVRKVHADSDGKRSTEETFLTLYIWSEQVHQPIKKKKEKQQTTDASSHPQLTTKRCSFRQISTCFLHFNSALRRQKKKKKEKKQPQAESKTAWQLISQQCLQPLFITVASSEDRLLQAHENRRQSAQACILVTLSDNSQSVGYAGQIG